MRLGVVSDIHGNLPALLAVVADAKAQGGVDAWVNLGDILSGPLWPAETADWLLAQDPARWTTIAGNHERWLLHRPVERLGASDRHAAERLHPAHRNWLAGLPGEWAGPHGLQAVHGSPGSDLLYLLESVTPEGLRRATPAELARRLAGTQPALLLCGHSHLQRHQTLDRTQLLNPGSVGLPAFDDDHPWPHVAEAGTPQARWAWVAHEEGADARQDGPGQGHGPKGWKVKLRAVDYDFETAARQAERHGRGDWADALRTGRVGRREAVVLKPGA
jgi:predicted phosphodiesterase